ncbi:ABC transporter substrate-binding protein [Lentzea californiensis]|uniref:ABC transporter substrate-binding protein n=1 Tax=Lentzea californiensis TaxID=438851 RepID=UPI002165F108|nr:extracellular solute-binding protein [Lentzea californiensis]MCR3750702.1 raffinose/stachyose/melibiose transport system substrate-binding protein [Lentzea californiensis]
MSSSSRALVAAIATTALLLSACGSGSSTSDPNTLKVAANATDRASMDAVVAAFEQENPGVTVNVTYADTDQLQSTLRTQLSSGTGPDVFTVWPGNGNPGALQVLQPAGYLADLSGRSFAANVPAGARPVTQTGGKTYLVPANYSGIGLIYTQKAMTEIGGQEPKTWDELIALCGKARAKGKVLLSLGNQTPWVTQLVTYALVATTTYADDPEFAQKMSDGKAKFADSGWKTALEKYLELQNAQCFSDQPLGTSYETSLKDVAQGRAVGVVQVASSLAAVRKEAGEGTELRMAALPAGNDPAKTRMPGAVSGAYGVNAKSGNADLALKFADFLGSENGQNLYNEKGGTLPAIPNASFQADPALVALDQHLRNGTTVPFMDQLWPNPKVQQEHFNQVQKLFSGSAEVGDVLSALDKAYAAK